MTPYVQPAVSLVQAGGWSVRVTAYGNTTEIAFPTEQNARSFAEGQAFRLGVAVVEAKPTV